MHPPRAPALLAIVGPTASGKSSLGLWLARELGGEIVACDSTQLYRGFDIGTAKPSWSERREIPHHLLDVLDPAEEATAGGYRKMARGVLEELRRRNRLPIFTVGTGLYLRALLLGLADAPPRSEELRERLRASGKAHGPGHLHGVLRKLDPSSADRIAPADEQKLVRAIEISMLSGKPVSQVHEAGRAPLEGWRALKIGLAPPPAALDARIRARTAAMLAGGWLAEAQALDRGGPGLTKPLNFIGYRELVKVGRGELSLEQARAAIEQATRQYAKRQRTWFRKEPGVRWFAGFGDDHVVRAEILAWLGTQGTGPVATPP